MAKKNYNYVGFIVGCDTRTSKDYRKRVELRETKLFWIAKNGMKFRKKYLFAIGEWPLYRLQNKPILIKQEKKLDKE